MNTELYRKSTGYKIFYTFNILILLGFSFICLYPFLYTLAISLSDMSSVNSGAISFIPKGINFEAYGRALTQPNFFRSLVNSLVYTVVATTISVVTLSAFAFAVANKELKGRNILMFLVVIPMFFNGGMVPNFLLLHKLHMINSIWAIVLPGAISPFYFFILYANFYSLPHELKDAAMIDGLTPIGTFFKICLPLVKATIATVTLFTALTAWNSWFAASIYLFDEGKFPVMLILRNLINAGSNAEEIGTVSTIAPASIKAATTILVGLPVLSLYLFLSKYFEKGLTLGSVKG